MAETTPKPGEPAKPPSRRERRKLALERRFGKKVAAAPGITLEELAQLPTTAGAAKITCIDYAPDLFQMQEVSDLDAFLAGHRPAGTAVRWINVDGLGDMKVLEAIAKKYGLHPLAIEDLLNRTQRPKADSYMSAGEAQARIFILARMLRRVDGRLSNEQVSIFLGHSTVLTFQEYDDGDVWDPIRERLKKTGSRLRVNDASFLAYALLDAMVDHCFPILEHYGDVLEELEERILKSADTAVFGEIHKLKREMLLVRRAVWPMRELINSMGRESHECLSESTKIYLRDVYDHSVQIIDILETYREVAVGLSETYMTVLSNRMNEVMKVLTMISVIFIPITFLSSVFGMNFTKFPWDAAHAFEAFAVACLLAALGMFGWFKRNRWI